MMSESEDAIVKKALTVPNNERKSYLDGACGGDLVLRKRVETLIREKVEVVDATSTMDDDCHALGAEEQAGLILGSYKLLEKLGEGGFGAVWAAEQREPVKRRVALKIIKLGMDTKQVVARFEAERQALAMMEHPNIAKVLDAGTTETGRPYFVMELVKGMPITQYLVHEKVEIRQKLELFVKVCQAIQHAHQKGIIHRDIKPSNVMVTLHDGEPIPKVIDFGIAKATQGDLTDKTIYTQYSQFIGTPAYMSPEQAEMSGLDIDTRSDIYSLGVLFYEMLTGKTPFDTKELMASGIDEMRKIIRERDPVKPSTRISQVNASSKPARGAHVKALVSSDLDWIVMKCLEKDRGRRYDTANGLALDVKRHLNDQPIQARPPSWVYLAQKAYRRNQLFYSVAVLFLVALIVGSTVIGVAWRKESASRKAEEIAKGKALKAQGDAELHAKEADSARLAAEKKNLEAREMVYAADMNLAAMAISENNYGKAKKLLSTYLEQPEPVLQLGWEWHHMWDIANPDDELMKGDYHEKNVTSTSFLGGSDRVVSSSFDGTIKIWDLETGHVETLYEMERSQIRTMAASRDGRFVGLVWISYDAAKKERYSAKVLDSRSGREVGNFSGSATGNQQQTLAFVSGKPAILFNGQRSDWSIYHWETDRVQELLGGRSGPVATSWDGQTVALGSFSRPQGPYQIIQLGEPEKVNSVDPGWRSDCVALSPNGKLMAMGGWDNGQIRLVNLESGETIHVFSGQEAWICALVFSLDGQMLYSASADQTIRVWDLTTFELLDIYRGHTDEVWSLDISPDGSRLVSGGKDNTVRIWPTKPKVEDSSLMRFIERKRSLSIANFDEGRVAVLAGLERNEPDMVYFYEIGEPKRLKKRSFQIPDAVVSEVTITQDWTMVALVRKASEEAPMLIEIDLISGDTLNTITLTPSRRGLKRIVAGVLLDLGDRGFRRVDQLDDSHDGAIVRPKLPASLAWPVAVAPDPDLNQIVYDAPTGEIFLYDADTGEVKSVQAHKYDIRGVTFSPDSSRIYSSSLDGFAKCWDAQTLEPIGESVRPQLTAIFDNAVSPDGSRLVTCGSNGRINIFDAMTLRELGALYLDDRSLRIINVEFISNEYLLTTAASIDNGTDRSRHFQLFHAPISEHSKN